MRQALASTERGYDLLAPKFDYTPFRTPEPVVVAMMNALRDDAATRPLRAGLDVCCGTGAALKRLRAYCSERVVGLDFSRGMLEEARRAVADAPGAAAFELVRGDALSLPFEAEFDVVTSVGAFGHILPEDEDRFVGGIARALRPGGVFVFATAEMPSLGSAWWWMARGFNAVMRVRNAVLHPQFIMYYLTFLWPGVRARLERHGFRVEARRDLCPAPYDRVLVVIATKA
jgi:ubiquinone/menaquinone biosynthesis C-methylase UbiE